jgi:hypothetical protein
MVCGASMQVPIEDFIDEITNKERDKLKELLE